MKPTMGSRSTAMFNRNIPDAGISHTVPIGANYCWAFNFSACLSRYAYEQLMFIKLAKDKGLSSLLFYFWHFPLSPLLSLSASVVGVAPKGFLSLAI